MPVFQPALTSFSIQFAGGDVNGLNPSTNTTYFTSNNGGLDPGLTNIIQESVPIACTLRAVVGRIFVAGAVDTAANAGTVAIRINNTTDVTVTSTVTWQSSANYFASTNLNTALTDTDMLAFKFVTPATFTTPPTLTFIRATAYFERTAT